MRKVNFWKRTHLMLGATFLLFPGIFSHPAIAKTGKRKVTKSEVTLPSGLIYKDLAVGKGDAIHASQTAQVHYTGWLFVDGKRGAQFDSSANRGPFEFKVGAGQVIKGWDEGVAGMKVGGKRVLTIPPLLAYGPNGIPNAIPGNSTLQFEVELLAIH